jgi:hypothetical protein
MRVGTSVKRHVPTVAVLALASVLALLSTVCSSKNTVTASGGGLTNYSVYVQKFRYHGMPATIPSGVFTIGFSNRENLPITHEMVVVSLPSGKSAQDVINDAKSGGTGSEDNWLHFGEIGDVDTGATIANVFDLPPGNYAMACWQTGNLGDPTAKGKPHAARGMVFQFKVT